MTEAIEEIKGKILEAYEFWLMEFCNDEIHCKDQLIEASENRHRIDDFYKFVEEEI